MNKYPNDDFIIAGDFNLSCIDWSSTNPIVLKKSSIDAQRCADNLLRNTAYLGLRQHNHFVNASNNTLDLVFSSVSLIVTKSQASLVQEDISHTTLDITAADICIKYIKPPSRSRYLFRKGDYRSINRYLSDCDWSFLESNCLDNCIDIFYSILKSSISNNIPQKFIQQS